jgi:hypothetical protein
MKKVKLSEQKRKEIFKMALLDKNYRKKLFDDPARAIGAEISDDDFAAIARMKEALPIYDKAIDSLSGTVLCSSFGGPCGIA